MNILQNKLTASVLAYEAAVEANASNPSEANAMAQRSAKATREAAKKSLRISLKTERVDSACRAMGDPNVTAEEYYNAVQEMGHRDDYASAIAPYMGENVLTAFLLDKIGTYTATPFDNGTVVLNGVRGRFSTSRLTKNSRTISSLFRA